MATAAPPAQMSPLPRGQAQKLRLGEALVEQRLISQEQLQKTLKLQQKTRAPAG